MSDLVVPIKRLRAGGDSLPLPRYMTPGAAGLDLLADVDAQITIDPGRRIAVPTGLAVEIPQGFEAQIRPRSGLALKHGVTLLNAPGTIDSDYRGEIQVIMINLGQDPFTIQRGDRIAQIVVAPVAAVEWRETESLAISGRGAGGFGHTGTSRKE